MLPPAAPRAELHARDRAVATVVAAVVAAVVTAKPVRCILPPAQAVARRPRFPSNLAKTGLCIAATVTSHKAPAGRATAAAVIVALAINPSHKSDLR